MRELSLHILDLLENSLEAGATQVDLQIVEDSVRNTLTITVSDNGRGMDPATLARVGDPFFTTRITRHVGLGIPLLKAAAERCNGGLTVASRPGLGTCVVVSFDWDHIDRAPLGDMRSTLVGAILSRSECDLRYLHRVDQRVFEFDTREMRRLLGEVPLAHPQVRTWLHYFLKEGFAELYPGSQA